MDEYADLIEVLRDCVVLVAGARIRGGSGFFIAPGKVLTCAHVVAEKGGQPDQAGLVVEWNSRKLPARVVGSKPLAHGSGNLWSSPDLAVIELTGRPPSHPCVWLDDSEPAFAAPLYAAGFNQIYDEAPGLGGVACSYAGLQSIGADNLLQVKGDQLAEGMSGCPVLDLQRGVVCGVLKTARDPGSASGGLAIPAAKVRSYFDDAWQANQSYRWVDDKWRKARMAAWHRAAGRGLINPDEIALLHKVWDLLQREPGSQRQLHWFYEQIMGELACPATDELNDLTDLIQEASDTSPGTDGGHPLVRLCDLFADRLPRTEAKRVRQIAARIASQVGVDRTAPQPKPQKSHQLAIVEIMLQPAGPNERQHSLRIRTYQDGETHPVVVVCDDEPKPIGAIKAKLGEVLPQAIARLGRVDRDVVIEFVLPRVLMHEAVDEWDLGESWAPLGSRFPVILRSSDRRPESFPAWRRRWAALHTGKVVGRSRIAWIGCRDVGDVGHFYDEFERHQDRVFLTLAHQPGTAVGHDALRAALAAGMPAALWSRRVCDEHSGQPKDGLASDLGAPCLGDQFRETVRKRVAKTSAADVPHLVKTLRTEVGRDGIHYGNGLALLWDDPARPSANEEMELKAPA